MKRNGKIELLRFIFSFGVLWYHVQKYVASEILPSNPVRFDFFVHGAMGVEFFFIVSGFLMASSVFYEKESVKKLSLGKSTFVFMKKKILGVFPMHCLIVVPVFVATALGQGWNTDEVLQGIVESIPGFFFLQMAGFKGTYVNHIEWYLSAMFICMLIIYPFLRRFYKWFSRIIAPVISVFLFVAMAVCFGKLTGVMVWEVFVYRGVIRGFMELCMGIACFEICRNLKKLKATKRLRIVFTVAECVFWGMACVLIMTTVPYYYEFHTLICIAVATTISFSGLSYGGKIFDNGFFIYLGKLSLPIYMSQLILIELIPAYLGYLPTELQMTIAIIGTLIISVGLLHLTNLITKRKKA